MRRSTPKIEFSDEEFKAKDRDDVLDGTTISKSKVTAFTMLFGRSKWRKLKKQFAQQRVPDELPYTKEQIKKMSDSAYKDAREEIKKSQDLPSKDTPVYGTVHAPDLHMKGFEGQKLFIEAFGHDRYFEAMELDPTLNKKSYHRVLDRDYDPYSSKVVETKKSVRKRSRKMQNGGIDNIAPDDVDT